MKVTIKFHELTFSHSKSKQAYLNTCKWLAQNVVSKVEASQNISHQIHKVTEADLPTFKLELYCSLELKDIQKQFCKACKEFHKSFFVNQEYNCSSCKQRAYLDQVQSKLKTKQSYRKERLEYLLEKQ